MIDLEIQCLIKIHQFNSHNLQVNVNNSHISQNITSIIEEIKEEKNITKEIF